MKDIIVSAICAMALAAFILVLIAASYIFIVASFEMGDIALEIISICFPIITFGALILAACGEGIK